MNSNVKILCSLLSRFSRGSLIYFGVMEAYPELLKQKTKKNMLELSVPVCALCAFLSVCVRVCVCHSVLYGWIGTV